MFKGLIAALSALFVTLFSPQSSNTQAKNYFYYDRPDHIIIHLDVGETGSGGVTGGDTYGIKKYFLQGEIALDNGCIVKASDIDNQIEITDKRFLDISVDLVAPCTSRTLQIKGQKIEHNIVQINGKKYESTKKIPFGPLILHNKVQNEKVIISIEPIDHQKSMEEDATKKLTFKLVATNGEQIDPARVQKIRIRTLDAQKLMLQKDDGALVESIESSAVSFGSFTVCSFNRSGDAKIRIEATLEAPFVPLQVSSDFVVHINSPAFVKKEVRIVAPQSITPFDVYKIEYKILENGQIADPKDFEKVEFFIAYGLFVEGDQTYSKLIKNTSTGVLYIQSRSGTTLCKIDAKVVWKNGKETTTEVALPVTEAPSNQISLSYIKTDVVNGAQYRSTYKVRVSGDVRDKRVKIDVVMPKILYPQVYYSGFLTGKIDRENPYVYYEGIKYSGIWDALPQEKPQSYSGRLYNHIYTYFSTDKFDLSEVREGVDKLIILPNKYNTDSQILGEWDILLATQNALRLKERSPIEENNLSFVIGDASRYNPIDATIEYITLDQPNGIHTLDDNNSVQFSIIYNPFLVGKDIFISVKSLDTPCYGNSFKRTLTATGLEYEKEFPCDKSVCGWRTTITLQGVENSRLTYSKIEFNCEGKNAQYSVRSSYDMARYGCNRVDERNLLSPRTDEKGYLFVCVYPKGKMEVDPDTNATTITYDGSVSCSFDIAEEFAY